MATKQMQKTCYHDSVDWADALVILQGFQDNGHLHSSCQAEPGWHAKNLEEENAQQITCDHNPVDWADPFAILQSLQDAAYHLVFQIPSQPALEEASVNLGAAAQPAPPP